MGAHDYIYREIGLNLRKCRRAKPLSQEKLAKRVGLTRTSIIHIEKGRQKVPLDKLYQIAEILGEDILKILPPQKRPEGSHDHHLISQIDTVTRSRLEDEELGQTLDAIKPQEKKS